MPDEPNGGTPTTEIVDVESDSPEQTVVIDLAPTPEPTPTVVVAPAPEANAFDARVLAIETRLGVVEQRLVEHAGLIESRADADHSHPLPSSVQSLADHLDDVEGEEQLPQRRSILHRPIFGARR